MQSSPSVNQFINKTAEGRPLWFAVTHKDLHQIIDSN